MSINPECDYSFEMLYRAAYGKNIPLKEKRELQILNQSEINELVLKWVKKAGWACDLRKGSDGNKYLAFFPKLLS